jgi:predicted amidohydrolase
VDAGSAGLRHFGELTAQTIDTARTRVLAMPNIVGRGMAGRMTFEQDALDMDPRLTA